MNKKYYQHYAYLAWLSFWNRPPKVDLSPEDLCRHMPGGYDGFVRLKGTLRLLRCAFYIDEHTYTDELYTGTGYLQIDVDTKTLGFLAHTCDMTLTINPVSLEVETHHPGASFHDFEPETYFHAFRGSLSSDLESLIMSSDSASSGVTYFYRSRCIPRPKTEQDAAANP